jgi:ElaB/YqjD/DUF883 family membrane-anchored ribosome-binding protein
MAEQVRPLEDLREKLEPKLEEAKEQLGELSDKVVSFIKKNPGTSLLGAAAVGFLLGRLASRK